MIAKKRSIRSIATCTDAAVTFYGRVRARAGGARLGLQRYPWCGQFSPRLVLVVTRHARWDEHALTRGPHAQPASSALHALRQALRISVLVQHRSTRGAAPALALGNAITNSPAIAAARAVARRAGAASRAVPRRRLIFALGAAGGAGTRRTSRKGAYRNALRLALAEAFNRRLNRTPKAKPALRSEALVRPATFTAPVMISLRSREAARTVALRGNVVVRHRPPQSIGRYEQARGEPVVHRQRSGAEKRSEKAMHDAAHSRRSYRRVTAKSAVREALSSISRKPRLGRSNAFVPNIARGHADRHTGLLMANPRNQRHDRGGADGVIREARHVGYVAKEESPIVDSDGTFVRAPDQAEERRTAAVSTFAFARRGSPSIALYRDSAHMRMVYRAKPTLRTSYTHSRASSSAERPAGSVMAAGERASSKTGRSSNLTVEELRRIVLPLVHDSLKSPRAISALTESVVTVIDRRESTERYRKGGTR